MVTWHTLVWAGGRPALLLPRWCHHPGDPVHPSNSVLLSAVHPPFCSVSHCLSGVPEVDTRGALPAGGDVAHARWARSGWGTLLQHVVKKVQEHGMGYTGGADGHDTVG
jgi:hypothetical protein